MSDHPADQGAGERGGAGRLSRSDPTRIGGYHVIRRLGAGGMGVVYHAVTTQGDPVAIKVVRPEYADDPEFRRRFAREVAACARVSSRCTARVLAADVDAPQPYLVTEFVPGPNLTEQISRRGPLPPDALRALAVGLAESLVAIHSSGLVHRDLKPSNVLLAPSGPKVIDFGIASAVDATAFTRTGVFLGSPGWIAPEQATEGTSRDPAIDVFAWGLVVAYAATGRSPFGEGRPEALVYRIVHSEPDLTGLDPELAALVIPSLAKNPADRPASTELLAALTARFGAGTDVVLDRDWTPGFADLAATPPPNRSDRTQRPRTRSRRRPVRCAAGWIGGTGVAAVLAAGVYLGVGLPWETPAPASSQVSAGPTVPAVSGPSSSGSGSCSSASCTAAPTAAVKPSPVPAEAGAPAATQVVLYDPFAPESGRPRQGLALTGKDSGKCSASSLTRRPDVYRCFGVKEMFDPCFRSSLDDAKLLLCPAPPWTNKATAFLLEDGLELDDEPSDAVRGEALYFVTADRRRCTRFGGATGAVRGLPSRYACEDKSIAYGEAEQSRGLWTIKMQTAEGGDLTDVALARVWL